VIAMELLPGGTLKDRVEETGPLAPVEATDAILQVVPDSKPLRQQVSSIATSSIELFRGPDGRSRSVTSAYRSPQ